VAAAVAGLITWCWQRRRSLSQTGIGGDRCDGGVHDVDTTKETQLRALLAGVATEAELELVMGQIVPGQEASTWSDFAQSNRLMPMVSDLRENLRLEAAVDEFAELFRVRLAKVVHASSDPERLAALSLLAHTWAEVQICQNRGRHGLEDQLSANAHVLSEDEIRTEIVRVAEEYRNRLVGLAVTDKQSFMELLYLFYSIRGYEWQGDLPVPSRYLLDRYGCKWQEPESWVELVGSNLDRPKLRDFNRSISSLGGTEVAIVMGIRAMVTHVLFEGTRAEAKLIEAYFAEKPSLVLAVGDLFSSAIALLAWEGVRLDAMAIISGNRPPKN
jgi:hypothetical protein